MKQTENTYWPRSKKCSNKRILKEKAQMDLLLTENERIFWQEGQVWMGAAIIHFL